MASPEQRTESVDVSEAKLVAALHGQGQKWLKEGAAELEVRDAFVQAGLHQEDADELLGQLQASLALQRAETGRRNLLYGTIWFSGAGCAMAAVVHAGLPLANCILAGLVGLFGATLFVRGIVQLCGGRPPKKGNTWLSEGT